MQLTSRSAGSGTATARAPRSRASSSARSAVRFHTDTSLAPASQQRPDGRAGAAAGAEHERALARGRLAERGDQARGVGVLGGDLPAGREASACWRRRSRARPRWRCRRARAAACLWGIVTFAPTKPAAAERARRSPRTARAGRAAAGSASPPSRAPRAPRCASPASGCGRPASRARPGGASLLAGGRVPAVLLHRRLVGGGVRFEGGERRREHVLAAAVGARARSTCRRPSRDGRRLRSRRGRGWRSASAAGRRGCACCTASRGAAALR